MMEGLAVPVGGMGVGGSAGVGGAIGGLIGSWFGNGWGGGYNNRGGAPVVVESVGMCNGTAVAASAALDDLSALQTSVNGLGTTLLTNQNATNMAMCQGFSGVVANATNNTNTLGQAVTQGFSGLNTAVMQGNSGIQSTMCQGFSGLNTAVLVNGKDNALLTCQSTNAITSAIDNCCCNTQKTIMAEGCATRGLIKDIQTQDLRDQLCDAKSKISQLESQNFTTATVAASTQQLRNEMAASTNLIIQHVGAICGSKSTGS